MKEEIEELIVTYTRRVKDLEEMALASNTEAARARLMTKRNVFRTVIDDLNLLLRDEQD